MNEIAKKLFSPKILQEACSFYDISADAVRLIRGNSNLVYDCGDKILRLTHSQIRTEQDIAVEVDWLSFLKKKQLPVVQIVQSQNQKLFEKVGDSTYFTCVCFEKVQGASIAEQQWNKKHFHKLGRVTGMLHRVGQQYKKRPQLNYKNWDEIIEFQCYEHLPHDHRDLTQLYHDLVTIMRTYKKTKINYGLIHYDIHQGNYLLTEDQQGLALFDFEMVCESWYINDIAAVLYYARHFPSARNNDEFEVYFMKHFWEGYEVEYQIDSKEKLYIPVLLLYRDLIVYGFLNKIWTEPNLLPSQQVYLDRLAKSIETRRSKLEK